MKKCPYCSETILDDYKFCVKCGKSLIETSQILNKKKSNEPGKIALIVTMCLILGLLIINLTKNYDSNKNNSPTIEETPVEVVGAIEVDSATTETTSYSGNNCSVCGNPCKSDKEIRSNGDAVSKYEPYFLCGENMDCVYERERQNKVLQQSEEDTYSSNDYNFESDGDVLRYLLGKTFRQPSGGGYITFSSDGANLSGQKEYQWLSYESLGNYKGLVKLSSLDPNNPDGVLKLWVSCKDNAVTDGSVVFLYN